MSTALKEPDAVVFSTADKMYRRPMRPGVSASAFRASDGRWHVYLNAAIPADTKGHGPGILDHSICSQCGLGYSHVITEQLHTCNECNLEDFAQHAIYLQDLFGVELGWKMPEDYAPDVIRASRCFRYGKTKRFK